MAERMTRLILNAYLIEFLVVTALNKSHFDLEYKPRAQLLKDIAELIEARTSKRSCTNILRREERAVNTRFREDFPVEN